jgi:predicted ferric reductase
VGGHLWWYVARSAGLTAWVLLALATAAGVATATRVLGRRVPSGWLLATHRFLGGLAVTFVGVHVVGVVADDWVHFGPADVLVPLASGWRPVAVAWGIVAAWLLAAVELTSLVRGRLPARLWRWVHLASYVLFVSSTLHLFSAGTDTYGLAIRSSVVLLTGVVALLTIAAALAVTGRDEPPAPTVAHDPAPGSAHWGDRPPTHPPYADIGRGARTPSA